MDSELAAIAAIAYLHPEKFFHVLGISIAPAQGMLRGQDFRCLGRLDSRRNLLEV